MTCAYLQKAGYYKLEVWGAQGGTGGVNSSANSDYYGGLGGYSYGNITASTGSSIYIVIGQAGQKSYAGGFNGGGRRESTSFTQGIAGSGGGATHISIQNCGELKNCSSYKGAYNSSLGTYDGGKILIVAGGGGGGANNYSGKSTYYGSGGGSVGGSQKISTYCDSYNGVTYGGNQTTGGSGIYAGIGGLTGGDGSFGIGGTGTGGGNSLSGGGGGGGWYGGGGGGGGQAQCGSGGAGGSGYIGNSLLLSDKGMYQYSTGCTASTATATKTTCTSSIGTYIANAANNGNGYARITYLGT